MPQLAFEQNYCGWPSIQTLGVNLASVTFVPFQVRDPISLLTLNFAFAHPANPASIATWSASWGLYSLNGASLSLANWISGTFQEQNGNNKWRGITATSSAQNITPGTWFWGILMTHTLGVANNSVDFFGLRLQVNNAMDVFVGGAMTASTAALPAAIGTTALDVTFNANEFMAPMIILSA